MLSAGKYHYRLVSEEDFHRCFGESHDELSGAKFSYVSEKSKEELTDCVRILFEDEENIPEAYVTVSRLDGNIGSLLKDRDSFKKEFLSEIFYTAIQYGGVKLDCYQDEKNTLPYIYADAGFIPVCRIHFDPAEASEDWSSEAGQPDIIFMFLAERDINYEDYRDKVLKDKYPRFTDYSYIPYVEEFSEWQEQTGIQDAYSFGYHLRDCVLKKWNEQYSGNLLNMQNFVEKILKNHNVNLAKTAEKLCGGCF